MIVVRLMGGMGNQMFEYAAARRLALVHNTKLFLDLSHYENQPREEVPRRYELDCFRIKSRLLYEPAETTGVKVRFKKVSPVVLKEKKFSFNKEVLGAPNNSLLIGYWQSEKYFHDRQEEIRADFTFEQPLSEQKQAISHVISKEEQSVSVHVRRGDYVTHIRSSKFHGALPVEYYNRAATRLAQKIKSPHFFVFSDDPEWCRDNLSLGYRTTFIDHIPGTGHEDMRLSSLCRHNIIANSSFSWWGAWLNPNPNKIIIAPTQWFNDKSMDDEDVIPKDWIRI